MLPSYLVPTSFTDMPFSNVTDASALRSRSMPNPSTLERIYSTTSQTAYGSITRASLLIARPPLTPPRMLRKHRQKGCPPKRSASAFRQVLDDHIHEDLIGFDPGALPTEVTPLLNPTCSLIQESSEDQNPARTSQTQLFVEEIETLLRYTGPIFGTHLSECILIVIPVICIGHYSTTGLAAITLGSMFATITGFSIIQGFISALDTFLPGTWTSSHPELVGLWTQRMAVVMAACLVPILVLWFNAESILLLLKQDREVSHMAAQYLRWISLGLPAYTFNFISRRYYKSQGRFSVPTKITFIVAPVNALLTYTLIFGSKPLQIGFIGAPIASAVSFNLIAILFLLHAAFLEPRTAWQPLSMRIFSDLGVLVHLGLCGVGQIGLRLWAWELLTLASFLLGPVSLASQSILVISASTIFRIPFALGIASSVRWLFFPSISAASIIFNSIFSIGNLLGKKDAVRADIAAKSAIGLAITISSFASIFVMVFAKYWAYIFNHDPEVISIVARIMPLIALFQVFHGTCAVTGAIARARGKQITGAVVNLSAYYVMGFPIGIYLAFSLGYGLRGLWIGMTISLIYCASVGLYLCSRVDWESEVQKVLKRIQSDHDTGVVCSCSSSSEAEG